MLEFDIAILIETCYAAALDFELWPRVLAQVAASVGARGCALVPQDQRRATDVIASESLLEANAEYMTEWWRHDPWNPAAQAFVLQNGIVLRESDLIRTEDKRSNAFFQVFCRRHRIGDFAASMFVDPRDKNSYSVSVFRDPRNGLYSDEDIEMLRRMTQHVARAFVLSTTLSAARDHASGLVAGLERLSFGTIVLDGSGRVRDINSTAERLLRGYLRLDGDRRLHALFPGDRERFERLIAAALPGGDGVTGPGMMLRPLAEGRSLLVEAIPLRLTEAALAVTGTLRGGALILMHDLFTPARPDIEALLTQLGLGPAEARLALLVGRGQSPRAAAEALQIAEGTARVHLRSCFAKLGITRQSELAVIVTRLDSLVGRSAYR